MLVMTYSDARKNFSSLLNRVKTEGEAIVKRADGSRFRITVEKDEAKSPFDGIKPVLGKLNLSREEIVSIVREGRER
ncbi:MAG: prevent-host-death protein [Treponema sp.]|nr:prevent-host-death protein [Treponema sp.]